VADIEELQLKAATSCLIGHRRDLEGLATKVAGQHDLLPKGNFTIERPGNVGRPYGAREPKAYAL
jgi:hypothetical protein